MQRSRILGLLLFLICASARGEDCWEQAAKRYGVSAQLLYAIARVESGLNPAAVNRTHFARTGSYDIGLMQVKSSHLRALAQHGIHERDLLDPCTNIHIGAWLLADSFSRSGATWDAVGAYNASCSQLKGITCQNARSKYAWRVYQKLSSREPARRVIPEADTGVATSQQSHPLIISVRVSQ